MGESFCPSIQLGKIETGLTAGMWQALFRRGQLKALVDVHSQAEGLGGNLSMEEISIIRGALDLTSKIAVAGMTPLEKVLTNSCLVPCSICCT